MTTTFGTLKEKAARSAAAPAAADRAQENRKDRKAISGYFSPAMSLAMRTTAMHAGMTLQDAMAEAFNMWLVKQGQSPIGE